MRPIKSRGCRWSWEASRRGDLFADADLERALDATVFQIYSFNGERCTANSRALIQREIFDEFVEQWSAEGESGKGGQSA